MGKTSIKVILAGRNYPLTINEGEEKAVQEAVDGINNSIKRLQENYAVKDMQDLLAMTALKLATQSSKGPSPKDTEVKSNLDEDAIVTALQEVSKELDK
jgi:cell division protein ZapA